MASDVKVTAVPDFRPSVRSETLGGESLPEFDMTGAEVVAEGSVEDTFDMTGAEFLFSLEDAEAAGVDQNLPQTFDDPEVGMPVRPRILDVIGDKESPKGYNIAYGNVPVNLDKMTVNQVLKWQDEYVRGGSPSSAVGRYQFIRKTLRDLVKKEGLTGDELFDEALQDRLAVSLLNRRGYDKYLAGEISDEKFANNLAKEWASLPVVSGEKAGLSYYAGDSLNKALIGVDDIMTAVRAARADSKTGE